MNQSGDINIALLDISCFGYPNAKTISVATMLTTPLSMKIECSGYVRGGPDPDPDLEYSGWIHDRNTK